MWKPQARKPDLVAAGGGPDNDLVLPLGSRDRLPATGLTAPLSTALATVETGGTSTAQSVMMRCDADTIARDSAEPLVKRDW